MKWYENLGIGYTGQAKSQTSFYDTMPNIFRRIVDTFQYGAHHSVPISLSLPAIGIFQVAPQISYDETWYQRKTIRTWNPGSKKLDTTSEKGFYTARDMTFGLSVNTKIFGMINSTKKDSRIVAIRHEIRPNFGIFYHPNFNKKNQQTTQVDTLGTLVPLSFYDRNIFSSYSGMRAGGITFGIDNTLQMKVRNKKDTGEAAIKKISIIDGFSINSSYNLLADSFPLDIIQLSARSTLFDKININASARIDPYNVGPSGRRLKTLVIQKNPLSLGRFTDGSLSISSSFRGGNGTDKKKDIGRNPNNVITPGYTNDEYTNELAYIRNNPAEYADFKIPWSVNFGYSLNFNKSYQYTTYSFLTHVEQNVNFGGTLNLTPKWQMGVNGFYNISLQQLNTIAISISREMHCWQIGIQLSPVGSYRFFSINISPKSGILRDLRINRTRSFYDGVR